MLTRPDHASLRGREANIHSNGQLICVHPSPRRKTQLLLMLPRLAFDYKFQPTTRTVVRLRV